MSNPVPRNKESSGSSVWLPLIPSGIALFSQTSFRRLVLIQILGAGLCVNVLTLVLITTWGPVFSAAVIELPEEGLLRKGILYWGGEDQFDLAGEGSLLLAVDLYDSAPTFYTEDVKIEFNLSGFKICSLPGCFSLPYPTFFEIDFNRAGIKAWWGAWKPAFLLFFVVGGMVGLVLSWMILAVVYAVAGAIVARIFKRKTGVRGVWQVCCVAQLPIAFILVCCIYSYGASWISIRETTMVFLAHMPLGFAYSVISIFWIPRLEPNMKSPQKHANSRSSSNPFSSETGPK
ncbi:MAG TPA: hypothetical protein EYQ50_08720 [Verrucomicrobiales bacterium]|nr:hypothetical protein [Verrucomicrobiales bacterium]HIL68437.1 hypothetical protein [Verrucomicrobiota bacterium]